MSERPARAGRAAVGDADSQPIVQLQVPALPPSGKSGKLWRYKVKQGLQLVQLKDLGPQKPGMFKLTAVAKHWYASAAADEPAASTLFTATIGGQCFRHAATKKKP